MKRLISFLLVLSVLFCGGAVAFADDTGDTPTAYAASNTFTIDNTSLAVKVGESAMITAYEYGLPIMNATWTVSNPSIASVSNGMVTGKQLGTTAVTATNSSGQSVTCYVHVILKGIDVSAWQKTVDWNTIAAQGTDFALIRTGYGKTAPEVQTDAYFASNYDGATRNGIKVGVYHYSYAENVEDAIAEANFCLSILNGRSLDYPVFYDIEDTVHRTMDKELMADVVEAFCTRMEEAGYRAGVYSSVSIFNSNLSSPRLDKYDRWVASWGRDVPNFDKAYTIWQYAYGTLPGVTGNVDLNYSFKDYSKSGTPVNPDTPSTPSLKCDTSSYTFGNSDVYYYKVFTTSGTVPTAASSNPSVVTVTFGKKVSDGYIFQINNVGQGSAVITTTAADGTSVSFPVTGTKGASTTLRCDTTSPYVFGSNSAYYYKVYTTSSTAPTAVSSNPAVVSVQFGKKDSDGYIFQINNVGQGTAVITTTAADGSSCSFQATGNKSSSTSTPTALRCDTTAPYTFGSNSAYYYKVYTTSSTAPTAVSSNPAVVSVQFGKKDSDGYIFQINNAGQGTAVITTTAADGSSCSFQATGNKTASVTTPTSSSLACDTTAPFTIKTGNLYTFLFTPKGNIGTPQFTTGNGSVLATAGLKLRNGSYLLTVKGMSAGSTGVYATLPGQQPVKYCTVTVA